MRSKLRDSRRQRGQSLVELAIFAPVMVLILLLAIDFGRAFMIWVNVNNMARIGANYAAINPDGWQGAGIAAKQQRYEALMEADYEQSGCTAPAIMQDPNFSGYTFGSTVEVDVSCEFGLLTPFLANLFGGGSTIDVGATATFTVRVGSPGGDPIGGTLPSPEPTVSPPPTATPTNEVTPEPTPTPDPNVTPDPNASPTPTPTPEPTFPPVQIDFYGTPTSDDSQGGGPAPSPGLENIVGIPDLVVSFSNTTVGEQWVCLWDFGDGTASNSCASTVQKTYTVRGHYHVTLNVNAQSYTRPGYVLVGCKVPSFSGRHWNQVSGFNGDWANAGFDPANISPLASGNFRIRYQSLAGGLLNPPGGCADAQISVGP
ncbi:MAG TPA: TadE/TadG family type IV pilus assembly protein [Candidatus Limnocylindria bacterium]|nr:TadE/TadG family type IV pilus assembly protein [Candidatus Limnocylindria bacterium]